MKKKVLITLGVLSFFIITLLFLPRIYDWVERYSIVKSTLNLEELPNSTKVISCRSHFTTDVLTACYLEVDPNDFNELLQGYLFQKRELDSYSHHLISPPYIGKNFKVSYEYFAFPKEFVHGGFIKVYTDSTNENVLVDIYIE